MNLLSPEKRLVRLYFSFFLIVVLSSAGIYGQARKTANSKTATAKKTAAAAKDAKKSSAKEKPSAKSKTAASSKTAARDKKAKEDPKKASKKETLASKSRSARDKDNKNDKKKKVDPKKAAEERRAEAARRKAEEARRQAALAERRRREQAAREARARKLAFERGLRTDTVENIAKDNTDGEDLQIRRAAVEALGSHAGTVVVMEAQTGKVVTIVNQDWGIRDSFKPCSTIKLVTGVAGISEDVINESGGIGSSTTGMDLNDALAFSNNGYFQRVGSNIGSSKMINYALSLGLGTPTGINAEGESAGKLPYGNNNARIYSHGDDFEVTPLQLAVMVSAIANGGKKVTPQIARQRSEKAAFRPHIRGTVNLPQRDLQGVIPGMIGAAEYGTARRGVDASMGVAGKTGSCISKGSWVGLFASVAPVEQPKYSVVVITRGQNERGKYAAAIAGKVYNALRPRLERSTERAPIYVAAKPKPQTAAELADDEENDLDATAETAAADVESGRDVIVAGQGEQRIAAPQQAAPKKLVTKTGSSKPKFSPVIITYKKDSQDKEEPAKSERPRVVKNK